jgi:drug/metabolite transporter (DMT)-like permease
MTGARIPGAGLLVLWNRLPGNLRGTVLVLLAGLFYSMMSGLIKHLGGRIPSFEIVFFRSVVVLIFLTPVLVRTGLSSLKTRRPGLHFQRVLLGATALNATYYALTAMPIADVTVITFSRSLFATVLAVIFLRETVGGHRWAATVAGFIGVVVILRPGEAGVEPAALFALIASCAVAGVMIIVRKLSTTEPMVTMMAYPAIFVCAVTAAPAAWYWVTPDRDELLLLIAMSLISLAAQWCFIQAYRAGETSALAPVDYVRLLFATLVGMAFFGEVPDWATVAGSAIIIASTLYVIRREAKPPAP